jgi:hypothetical protein
MHASLFEARATVFLLPASLSPTKRLFDSDLGGRVSPGNLSRPSVSSLREVSGSEEVGAA